MKTKLIAAIIIATASVIFASPAHAAIDWGDSRSTKENVKNSCRSGGGTFTENADGSYNCIVTRPDGTYVHVFCDASGMCSWYTDDNTREQPNAYDLARPISHVDNALAPATTPPTRPLRKTQIVRVFQLAR